MEVLINLIQLVDKELTGKFLLEIFCFNLKWIKIKRFYLKINSEYDHQCDQNTYFSLLFSGPVFFRKTVIYTEICEQKAYSYS